MSPQLLSRSPGRGSAPAGDGRPGAARYPKGGLSSPQPSRENNAVNIVAHQQKLKPAATTGVQILAVAAAYYGAAKLGLLLALVRDQVTPLWPPTGIALVCLLLWGLRLWPGIALGAFLVNISFGPSMTAVTLIAVGNTLAPVCAYLLLRLVGFHVGLRRLRDALALVFLGAFASMLVSATVGSVTLIGSGALPPSQFWATWSVWWTGDAMGVLVVAPLLLAVTTTHLPWRTHPQRWAEAAALLGSTLVLTVLATRSSGYPLLFLVFPPLIWAALRFQLSGAAPCALVVSTMAILAAAARSGPFTSLDVLSTMITLQAFNGSVALTGLLLATVTTERNQAQQMVERACIQLADAVAKLQPDATLHSLLPESLRPDKDPH